MHAIQIAPLLFIASGVAHASSDPVQANANNGQNFNRYWYGNNNPYKFVDPDGRKIVFANGSSDEFKGQVGEMIEYLNKSGAGGVFERLESRPEIVTIEQATDPHDMGFNRRTVTITIDPLSGLEVAPGKVQTPALGALHEAGHAEAHLDDPRGVSIDMLTKDADFTNLAERKVIENVETPAATTLNEPTRTSHDGTPVFVRCPTCSD